MFRHRILHNYFTHKKRTKNYYLNLPSFLLSPVYSLSSSGNLLYELFCAISSYTCADNPAILGIIKKAFAIFQSNPSSDIIAAITPSILRQSFLPDCFSSSDSISRAFLVYFPLISNLSAIERIFFARGSSVYTLCPYPAILFFALLASLTISLAGLSICSCKVFAH